MNKAVKLVSQKGSTSIYISACIEDNGDLRFSGQDIGDAPEEIFGDIHGCADTLNVACLAYSVVRHGSLVAYRWDGEQKLSAEKFVAVERIDP
jgi:hypothetical protein